VYVIADQNHRKLFSKRLPNDLAVVLDALEPFRDSLETVAVESTYNWYWLVDGLLSRHYPVLLANPCAMKQYDGLKHEDDHVDAAFLARLASLRILPTGYIYPKSDRSVRDLLRRRILLVQQRTAIILSLQNLFCRQSGRTIRGSRLLQMDPAQFEGLLGGDDCLGLVARQQRQLIQFLSERIHLFEKKALEKVRLKPIYKLLLTIPGVGPILSLTIWFETGDIGRFRRAGNYSSYCRTVRATRVSNTKSKGQNNRRNGNRYLAWAFVEAAHQALLCCPAARSFYDRKKAQCNGALATKALASKWSKAAYYVMKRQEAFDLRKVFG